METVQRITGWSPGSVEHSVIRVVEEGIEMEGVVLGGSLEEPFAIRYAVMAYPDGRCRGVTARAIGEPILIELLADGKGGWTDDDGMLIRGLDGALDVDLGISPVAHALMIRRLGLGVGESAEVSAAGIDVLGGEIRIVSHSPRSNNAIRTVSNRILPTGIPASAVEPFFSDPRIRGGCEWMRSNGSPWERRSYPSEP